MIGNDLCDTDWLLRILRREKRKFLKSPSTFFGQQTCSHRGAIATLTRTHSEPRGALEAADRYLVVVKNPLDILQAHVLATANYRV